MPDIDKGYDSHTMFETCISSLLFPSSSLVCCCTYSSDNTSLIVGKNKSLLKLTKDTQGESPQKIFYMGWSCHFAHFCAQKCVKALSIQVGDCVIDLLYHFKRSVKKKATSRETTWHLPTHIKKMIKHVTTHCLSLEKSLDRTLLQWDTLKSYFLSLKIMMKPKMIKLIEKLI